MFCIVNYLFDFRVKAKALAILDRP